MSVDINSEWANYINNQERGENTSVSTNIEMHLSNIDAVPGQPDEHILNNPKCSDLNISTQTKVVFLSQEIDIYKIFWLRRPIS